MIVARVSSLIALLCLSFGATAVQAATPPLRDAGPAGERIVSGGGLVATAIGQRTVRIVDESLRARRLLMPRACTLGALSARYVLLNCSTAGRLIDLAAGTRRTLPYPKTQPGYAGWTEVGDRWARVDFSDYKFAATAYVSLDDGRVIEGTQTPTLIADLNRPELYTELCAPLAVPFAPFYVYGTIRGSFEYQPPFGATAVYGEPSAEHPAGLGRLVLVRCGDARVRTLVRCGEGGCPGVRLGRSAVVWSQRRTLRGVRLEDGATLRWRVASSAFTFAGSRLWVVSGHRLLTARVA